MERRIVDRKKLPFIVEVACCPHSYHNEELFIVKEKDVNSLDRTIWRYQYHVVFAPEYRRLEICGSIKADMVRVYKPVCISASVGLPIA